MNPLAAIIDDAVAKVIAEQPKLFSDDGRKRAQKILTKKIVRELTREQATGDDDGAPTTAAAEPAMPALIDCKDPRAQAYCRLRELAGAVRPIEYGGKIYLPAQADVTAVRALNDWPAKEQWIAIFDKRMIAAWMEFFAAHLPADVARRSILDPARQALMPWSWPPAKNGKIYEQALDEELVT